MRTYEIKQGLRLPESALPEMKARLALLDAAISALQSFQEQGMEDISDEVVGSVLRPRPFLVARRDSSRAEKAS